MTENVQIGSLTLSIKKDNDVTFMHWLGESTEKDPMQSLLPFFQSFVKEVSGRVKIVFNELAYMNSSTIHPFILFIKDLNNHNIKTEIIYNKSVKWQEGSFKALAALVQFLPNIEVTGS